MEDGHLDPRERRFIPLRSSRDSGQGRVEGVPPNNNIIVTYVTANGLSPGGSGYNACT